MNKKTVALSVEDYGRIMNAIECGFTYTQDGREKKFRPNRKLATILKLEANLGLRISDVLSLSLSSIKKDGNRRRLDIIEQKTGKTRQFTVPNCVYELIFEYAEDYEIDKKERLFDVGERAVQKQLGIVCDYLNIEGVSTHSFRKTFATKVYTNSQYDIELVRQLLQHSNTATTQRYIGISSKRIEDALKDVTKDLL